MPNGLMIVESRPSSPEDLEAFHDWYDREHVPELLQIEGFASARRLSSHGGDTFVAVYEIEGDVQDAKANLEAALKSGSMSRPVAVQLDPPPTMRYFEALTSASRSTPVAASGTHARPESRS
jgi:hypothetical protein